MPRSVLAVVSVLFACACIGPVHAQVTLHALVSPDAQSYGRFGASVGHAGDVDGDGVPDLVVGAPSEGGDTLPGRAHVFSGATGAPLLTIASDEEQRRGDFGFAVAGVQGEATAHVAVSAPRESAGRRAPRGGNLYLFEGPSGDLREDTDSPNEGPNGRFGFRLRTMPDLDGDGIQDVVVGAPSEGISKEPPTTGRAYVLSGDDGDDLLELEPPADGIRLFAYAVAGGGDVNQDGAPDLIVGAIGGSPDSGRRYAGAAYVYDGDNGDLLYRLTSPNAAVEGRFGSSVASVQDANGDDVSDWIVGAPGEKTNAGDEAGRAYLFSGADGRRLHTLVSPTGQSSGRFGEVVEGGVDFNGDGAGDLLIAAPSEASSAGRVHLFSGADGALLRTLQSPRDAINGGFGAALARVGDMDGDGIDEVVVGATGESAPDGTERAGAAYVFSGASLSNVPSSSRR